MPDEKRIKDFEPATNLLIDDWFAVDSPSQGTRKMQASMFQEGLQTQITTNTENIALHSGQISVLQQGVGNIGDKVDVLDAAITVEAYSASKLYAVGEDCVYEGVRYKCITAIETPEAFDPNKWQAISIEGELNELNSSLSNKANLASPTFTGTPKAPTATSGTSTTQIATTAFVDNAVDDKIIYRDVTIASITMTGGSVQTPTITLPSVSGYSIWGATIRSAAGAANGQLIIVPKLSNNYITIYNPTSASITATNITIRYILVKN